MSSTNNTISCPNCGHEFDVEEVLFQKAEAGIKKEYERKLTEQIGKMKKEQENLQRQKEEFEAYKTKEKEVFERHLQKKIEEMRKKDKEDFEMQRKQLSDKIAKELSEDLGKQLEMLKEENEKKSKENKALKNRELQLLEMQKKLEEKEEEMELKMKKQFLEKQREVEAVARQKERDARLLRERELEKQLEDQKKLIEEMQRKAEQGSMQLQGEVLELELEEMLRSLYPFDTIQEVPKGFRGADMIQEVKNTAQRVCGKIIYETKRTKDYSSSWIPKLKQDQLAAQADIAVLVTQAMPKDVDEAFVLQDGVWICSYGNIKNLSFALRHMLIRLFSAKQAEVNMSDKMALVYTFVTSEEFKQRIQAIVDGFSGLKEQLEKEKRAMSRIWKEREKQIEIVINNTVDIYGSVKGIAGAAVQRIDSLELDDDLSLGSGVQEEIF